jgi:aldehyde dehydrogenase (NAD+)
MHHTRNKLYSLLCTTIDNITMEVFTTADFEAMHQHFASGAMASYRARKDQLNVLRNAIEKYEAAILDALYKDLHKPAVEAYGTEVAFVYAEISHALKNLKQWMKPTHVKSPLIIFPSKSRIVRDALGVVLVIAPWNYPFQLLFGPLIGAIAGGNCAVLKPSELTPHTSKVIAALVNEFFDPKYIRVVEGDGAVIVPAMMNENRFDHVFFTGSITIGKEIAKMAAPKLVSVTLELGGKCPCIVDEDANISIAAKRITWGKFINTGQTCVAPDYLIVHESKKDALLSAMRQTIKDFYGTDPQQSPDYGRIVNKRRLATLVSYLQQGTVIQGGQTDEDDLYFAPTLMANVPLDAPLMQEEIFGPILPVFTFSTREEALLILKHNPNPLSFYYFGSSMANEEFYIQQFPFGGGCINNTLVHLANAELPFGGVGNSGVGAYHGKYSFDTFTRAKPILKTATWLDLPIKYPPYKGKMKYFKRFMK